MNDAILSHLEKFDAVTRKRFDELRQCIYESTSQGITEKLWAKLPSFYAGEHFIRLIPFKDHINMEASAVISHKDALSDYKITPKGMLQIFHRQPVPYQQLKEIVKESLE